MNNLSHLLVPRRATQLTVAIASFLAWTTSALAQGGSVAVRVNEGVRYVPAGAPGGTAAGVVRTIEISIANLSDRQLDLNIEYAMFALDAKNALKTMKITENNSDKGKATLSLGPRESRIIRAEARHAGELANAGQSAFGKPRDLGNVVEPANNYYGGQYYDPATGRYYANNYYGYRPAVPYVPPPPPPPNGNTNDPNYRRAYNDWYNHYYNNNNYYNYNHYNYRPPEIQAVPTTVQRMGQPAQSTTPNTAANRGSNPAVGSGTVPATERYYGYSVAVYSGADLVARVDKNPANIANFGVQNVKDAPAAGQPRRR
jgi:uncharacterized protein (DUF2147 family)